MNWKKQGQLLVGTGITLLSLSGCFDDGSSGTSGTNGVDGSDGSNGNNSLVIQTALPVAHEHCFQGGTQIDSGTDSNANLILEPAEIQQTSYLCQPTQLNQAANFQRIATFPVCLQLDSDCNVDTETAAEIVAASVSGNILIYTDSPAQQIGFIDINNPQSPTPLGVLALTGEPTSVAVKGDYALVAVNTSTDFIAVSGQLDIVDIASQSVITAIDLGGQPDSVAISPDGQYAAVVIENERDEDLADGSPPQLPAGYLVVVNTSDSNPANWSSSQVDLSGLALKFPTDPEPEYVDINSDNIAVVSLQENNHIVLVDLSNAEVVNHFSAGTVDLSLVDASEGALRIEQSENLTGIPREPDGVSWINNEYFVTADEGDLEGGSRGFSIFNKTGELVWTSANQLDHLAAQLGHYPDKRSGNKGNEPENIELGVFGNDRYLFVNSERSSLVFVYDMADPKSPLLKQVLPAAAGPEGGLAIPARNLMVVASETDSRGDKLRSSINLYQYNYQQASYPSIESAYRPNATPIAWGALSGLTADLNNPNLLYSIEDSFYSANRIFEINVAQQPAKLTSEILIVDSNDVLATYSVSALTDASVDETDATRMSTFDQADLAAMINADKSVNLDPEGIAKAIDGGFWIASEGEGTQGDSARPINSHNLILKTDSQGIIQQVIGLPDALNAEQIRFGLEGIAEYQNKLYVVFQRAWGSDAHPRIGIYDLTTSNWSFVFYPLDAVESQNAGWVGLSEITSIGNGEFLIVERDNQSGKDAAIKRLYRINLATAVAETLVAKTLVRDLMNDLTANGGLVAEKIEGAAILANGEVYIVNDNDGVDDNSGETQLINLGEIID